MTSDSPLRIVRYSVDASATTGEGMRWDCEDGSCWREVIDRPPPQTGER